jgi:hypothetical protein
VCELETSALVRCLQCYNITTACLDANGNLVILNLDENKHHVCSKLNIINESDDLTVSKLTDELFLQLIRAQHHDQSTGKLKRTYVEQAKDLIYRIAVFNPPPIFEVHLSDILDDKIRRELASLDDSDLDDIMRDSIGRIFESIDEHYYNLSIRNHLRWGIVA